MRPWAFLVLLVTLPLAACHSSASNPNCIANLSRYTDDENDALAQFHAGNYARAFDKFGKAGQSRLDCTHDVDRRTEGMNAGYAAFDASGQAAAAARLGRDADAKRLMAS